MKKKARRYPLPSGLEIKLNSKDNLAGPADGAGPRAVPFEAATRAVELFAAARGRGAGGVVTITGGEPFLDYSLLCRLTGWIRKKYPRFGVEVECNGTLLTPRRCERLIGLGADLWVRFNGSKAATDPFLKFAAGGGSVFDTVAANLAALTGAQRRRVCVSALQYAGGVGRLEEGFAYLRRWEFKEAVADLAVYDGWTPARVADLRRALHGVRASYLAGLVAGSLPWPQPSRIYGIDLEPRLRPEFPPAALTLSCDGVFFPCPARDLTAALPFAVGSARTGLDLERLQAFYARLDAALEAAGSRASILPPAERLLTALAAGRDPAGPLAEGAAAALACEEELGWFMPVERALRLLAADPGFGNFMRRPKELPRAPLESLELSVGRGGLSRAREQVDRLLWSPGAAKTLVLRGRGEKERALSVYAALRAHSLGKKLDQPDRLPAGGRA